MSGRSSSVLALPGWLLQSVSPPLGRSHAASASAHALGARWAHHARRIRVRHRAHRPYHADTARRAFHTRGRADVRPPEDHASGPAYRAVFHEGSIVRVRAGLDAFTAEVHEVCERPRLTGFGAWPHTSKNCSTPSTATSSIGISIRPWTSCGGPQRCCGSCGLAVSGVCTR
jgi:hypothetical protein